MTPSELDAIEARAKAATEGPWTAEHNFTLAGELDQIVAADGSLVVDDASGTAPADVEFICAARSDVPALVEEVRALRKALYDAREAIDSECGRRHSAACDAVTAILGDSGPEVLTKSP